MGTNLKKKKSHNVIAKQNTSFPIVLIHHISSSSQVKSKLKDWLFQGSRHLHTMDIKVDAGALDIICYLAKETVAEIVDIA